MVGYPTKQLYSQLSGRQMGSRMQSSGRCPLLLFGSTMVACASMPNTDVPRGKAEGIKPTANHTVAAGLDCPESALKVWVLGKLCDGEEVHGRCLLLIYKRTNVRELLTVAALCSHNFKIRTTCQPLTYLCVQGLKLQITMYYVTQGNQYCLTKQGGHQWTCAEWHHTKTYIYKK